MARIEVNVDTYVDVDVDVRDIIEECSPSEIRDVLDYLQGKNFISGRNRINPKASHYEVEFDVAVNKLSGLYLQITATDWDIIKEIIEKY